MQEPLTSNSSRVEETQLNEEEQSSQTELNQQDGDGGYYTVSDFFEECFESHVLVDDVFGGDLGYIVIDSLIENVLLDDNSCDKILPWNYNKTTGITWELHGGQFLHLVYLVEKLLLNWKMFHPNVHLVYSKNWYPSFSKGMEPQMAGLYILARQILYDHLYHANCFEGYHQFNGDNLCEDGELLEHMKRERPVFICVPYSDREFTAWNLFSHNTNVVIKLDTTKTHLVGYHIQVRNAARDRKCVVTTQSVLSIIDKLEVHIQRVYCNPDNHLQSLLVNSLIDTCRYIGKINRAIVTSIIATIYVQEICSLQQRALLPEYYYSELNLVLDTLYVTVYKRWNTDPRNNFIDLFDGKLCHFLLHKIMTSNGGIHDLFKEDYSLKVSELCDIVLSNIEVTNDPLSPKQYPHLTPEFVFDTPVQLAHIENSIVQHEKLVIDAVTFEDNTTLDQNIFRENYHYHNNRRFKENHSALLKWASRLKQHKTIVTTFPKFFINKVFECVQQEQHKYITSATEKITDWIQKNHETISNSDVNLLQSEVEIIEYDNILEHGKHKEILNLVYNGELSCFVRSFEELVSTINDTRNFVSIWSVLCWCRFISEFMELKRQFLNVDRVQLVTHQLKESLRYVELCYEADGTGEDVINTNKLHLLMSIKHRSPTPVLKYFKNKKIQMLQDIDEKLQKLTPDFSDNKVEIRELMIRKSIISGLKFIPDKWQMELMDRLDKNQSILVSAPTSSGKTFIASYLIKRVLHLSETGLVVFIVPNNSLVNQVYLDLYTTLGRRVSGDRAIGIFTKYHRVNEDTCQVLISTPQMFEIMVLGETSSSLSMRKRISYLILDEIHSMNDEGGSCWETIMMMIRCPILALSATLGNPEPFMNWLKTIRNDDIYLVECKHRYVPLSYFLYDPNGKIVHIHPLAALNSYKIVDAEIQRLPTLGIKECFEFLAVTEQIFEDSDNPFQAFCDGTVLGDTRLKCMNRKMVRQFQEQLTEKIRSMCKDTATTPLMMDIFQRLRTPLQDINERTQRIYNYFNEFRYPLIKNLREQGLLPAICFIFDRSVINNTAEHLCIELELDPDVYDLWQDPFTALKSRLEIEKSIDTMRNIADLPEIAIPALRKGIGMHYATLNSVYQKEVERLLRANLLPLVLATTTLALGINMPVKSIIIGKESNYMNQVTFNQCSGRAGRRGLEIFGNVVFFDVKLPRIYRYLSAQVPSIRGSLGMTPSHIIRLLITQNEQNLKKTESDTKSLKQFEDLLVDHILTPLLSVIEGGDRSNQFTDQMKYLFRYNIEFFYRSGMINVKGQPLLHSGIIGHLHYTEPYNLLFAYFVEKKLFHNFVANNGTEEQLVIILCYLFGRYKITGVTGTGKSNILPEPPSEFIDASHEFNKNVLSIYSDCVHATTSNIVQQRLPYSRIDFTSENVSEHILSETLSSELNLDPETISSISPFAALSGNRSRMYHNFKHFISTMKNSCIASVSQLPFSSFYEHNISAFLLDLYITEARQLVTEQYSFLNRNEFDKLVTEFSERISTLYYGLSNQRILNCDDQFMRMLYSIMKKFKSILKYSNEEYDTNNEREDSDLSNEDLVNENDQTETEEMITELPIYSKEEEETEELEDTDKFLLELEQLQEMSNQVPQNPTHILWRSKWLLLKSIGLMIKFKDVIQNSHDLKKTSIMFLSKFLSNMQDDFVQAYEYLKEILQEKNDKVPSILLKFNK
jgi:hypothetical protein